MWRCYLHLWRHLSQDCWSYNIYQREVSENLLFSDPKKVGPFLEGLKYKGQGCGQEGGEGKLIKCEMKAQERHFWKTFTFLTSVPWPKWWMAEWVLNSWPIFAKPIEWETDVSKRQKRTFGQERWLQYISQLFTVSQIRLEYGGWNLPNHLNVAETKDVSLSMSR